MHFEIDTCICARITHISITSPFVTCYIFLFYNIDKIIYTYIKDCIAREGILELYC